MENERNAAILTGGRELRVHPLAHDTLETQARAHEADRDERERVRPRRVPTDLRNAPLSALPRCDRSRHGEERLDERPEEEPRAGFCAHLVADTSKGGPENEGDYGRERLLVGEVEGRVAFSGGTGEEAGKGQGELDGVAGLEATPYEDGREGDGVTGRCE